MCGIAGIIPAAPRRIEPAVLDRMFRALAHRGPDDQGALALCGAGIHVDRQIPPQSGDADCVLLHRRLSIIDPTPAGWQPMASEDGRYHIVLNGEIYNYRELRAELETRGRRFRTASDTEALLAAFVEWGPRYLTRLVGMFAFAVLDVRQRTLFLARDFFGIKPLYYTFTGSGFAFASEIGPLLELPGISRHANAERLYYYLRYGLTDYGGETMFADIRQLPAAHYMEISLDSPQTATPTCYWRLNPQPRADLSPDEAAGQLRKLFLDSVSLHLRSDVPVGSALSGGIDSSSIVMAMRQLCGSALKLHAFGYVADDPAIAEERWMDQVAIAAAADLHKVHPTAQDLVADLDALIDAQAEPFGSTSIYAQRRVFQLARESGVKVMLDGQGADELLAGYRPYVAARAASLLRRGRLLAARRLVRAAAGLPGSRTERFAVRALGCLLPSFLQKTARRLAGEDLLPPWLDADWFQEHGVVARPLRDRSGRDVLRDELVRSVERTSLPMLLRYEDRNSMAFGIESRVPFLTPALAEFVLSLPEEYLLANDGQSKSVFRRAMRGLVPDAVLDRRDKIGFATPEARWLNTLTPWVDRVLDGDAARRVPALRLDEIRRQWQAVRRGEQRFDFRVWRWINLIRWTERFSVAFP